MSSVPPLSSTAGPSAPRRRRNKAIHHGQHKRLVDRREAEELAAVRTEKRCRGHPDWIEVQQQQFESNKLHLLQQQARSCMFSPLGMRMQQPFGSSFCPQRLVSLYNLSIRYWDEGWASLATRTLQGALEMLRRHGLPEGCAAHTWDAMALLGGNRKTHLMGLASAAPRCSSKRQLDIKDRYLRSRLMFSSRMFVAAERDLEEVRGHLGSLLCRASLRGYVNAREGSRQSSRIKQALARVEDDLLLLQELQCMYGRPHSQEWGENLQQGELQHLAPLNLMPCMSRRINLRQQQEPTQAAHGESIKRHQCEEWARSLHQVLLKQIRSQRLKN